MESGLDILEQQNLRAMVYDLRIMPQVDLPKRWFGFKQRPTASTITAWRESFTVERDTTTNELDRANFDRLLKLVDLADECGATNLNFKVSFDGSIKYISLVGIWFPKNTANAMLSDFQRRLAEI